MALPVPTHELSEIEYLEIERAAQIKSEFFEGEMFAMSGGTRWHSLICANLITELGVSLKGGRCLVFDSNMRVKIEATGLYTYPDVVVACEEQRFVDGEMDTLLNPSVVVEVLSESTEGYDRGKKFEHYRQIPSLREYLLVSQTEARIDQFILQSDGAWLLREAAGLQSQILLPALGVTIPLAEIFANIQFVSTRMRPSRPPKP